MINQEVIRALKDGAYIMCKATGEGVNATHNLYNAQGLLLKRQLSRRFVYSLINRRKITSEWVSGEGYYWRWRRVAEEISE